MLTDRLRIRYLSNQSPFCRRRRWLPSREELCPISRGSAILIRSSIPKSNRWSATNMSKQILSLYLKRTKIHQETNVDSTHVEIASLSLTPDDTSGPYLFVAIDDLTRSVYGARIYRDITATNISDFLRYLRLASPKKTGRIVTHSSDFKSFSQRRTQQVVGQSRLYSDRRRH